MFKGEMISLYSGQTCIFPSAITGSAALWGQCWRLVLIMERISLCALLGRISSVTSFSGQKMVQEWRLSQDAEQFISNTPSDVNLLKLCVQRCSSLGDTLGGSWSSGILRLQIHLDYTFGHAFFCSLLLTASVICFIYLTLEALMWKG